MTDKPTKEHKFTVKQQRFIDFYDGNATKAARIAGYSHPKPQAARLLTNVNIFEAIKYREIRRNKSTIADRQERQEFWTKNLRDTSLDIAHRHKASELLGRSEADFTDIKRIVDKDGEDLTWKVEIVDPVLDI